MLLVIIRESVGKIIFLILLSLFVLKELVPNLGTFFTQSLSVIFYIIIIKFAIMGTRLCNNTPFFALFVCPKKNHLARGGKDNLGIVQNKRFFCDDFPKTSVISMKDII